MGLRNRAWGRRVNFSEQLYIGGAREN